MDRKVKLKKFVLDRPFMASCDLAKLISWRLKIKITAKEVSEIKQVLT